MYGQNQVSFFKNGRNVSLKGNTFNTTINDHDSRTSGIHILNQVISKDAMHDSSARCPPPRCHPDTREWAITTIIAFVKEAHPDEAVLWMHAPFGHGKSAVMQTVIEKLKASAFAHLVGGGFFFGRNLKGRDKAHYLLPTILYQIAINVPGIGEHISNALNADPSLPHKSIEAQLYPLLVKPFQQFLPNATYIPTIFIDGLDECDTIGAQRSVLKMVADVISCHKLPLRFVIASRPESHINACFKAEPLSTITTSFELDDDFESMMKCLRDGFDEIYTSHADVMYGIPKPWPPFNVLYDLVRRASGQYLFVSTVISFIGDEYANPLEQLQLILSPNPLRSSAFSSMDALYTQILSVCRVWDRERLLRVLAAMIILRDCTIASLSDLLELTIADILTVVRTLRAIIKIEDLSPLPPNQTCFNIMEYVSPKLSIRHVSLEEFITDKSRAGEFWIDHGAVQKALVHRADFLLARCISAGTVTVHPATWDCIYSLADRPPKYHILDPSTWPLFTKEFMKLENSRLILISNLQCARAFRFLNDHWSLLGRDISGKRFITNRLSAALHERLDLLCRRTHLGFFDLVRHLRLNAAGARLEASIEDISQKPNFSLDTVHRIIDGTHAFLDFRARTGAMVVAINRVTTGMLEDASIVGHDTHVAYREARILALSDLHEDLIVNKDPTWVMEDGPCFVDSSIWLLKPNIDDSPGSAMFSYIHLIHSSRFQNVLLDPKLPFLVNPDYALWFLEFLAGQCVEASILGPSFKRIHQMLRDLIENFIRKGALIAAFEALSQKLSGSLHNRTTPDFDDIDLYVRLFDSADNGVGKHLLDVVEGNGHTAILEHFLDIEWIKLFATKISERRFRKSVDIFFWTNHFAQVGSSPTILRHLLDLHQNWHEPEFKGLGCCYLTEDFVRGVTTWVQKHLDTNSDAAHKLGELCTSLQEFHNTYRHNETYTEGDSTDDDTSDEDSESDNVDEKFFGINSGNGFDSD